MVTLAEELGNILDSCFAAGCTGFTYFTYNGQAEQGGEQFGIEHYGLLDRNRARKPSWDATATYLKNAIVGREATILAKPVPPRCR